eukprot:NODE_1219_length_1205_cov_708.596522.p1 GENE.NODE_1219_length_1205_cov_708.596522~~NODE_1219_length_1205_cov_708.596522.p1  ORF type:complete len:290 (+),score=117.07 NODE_1219_length_1205_cov_708.596522:3-872(+)
MGSVERIYDLHGTNTEGIVTELNSKVEKYGVVIHHFVVKGVTIPTAMAKDFEDKTLFDPQTAMKHQKQASDRLALNNQEGQAKLKDECNNARMAAQQQAEVVKTQAEKETQEVFARSSRDIAELEAGKDMHQRKVLTDAELEVSKIASEILSIERDIKAQTQTEVGRLDAEAQAFVKRQEAEAKIECASKLANGKKAIGEAEGEASAAFAARRAFEADLERLAVLEKVFQNPGVQIATSQENTMGLNPDNAVIAQVAQQGLEALRAKLAEVTTTSLVKIQHGPKQQTMH